MLPHPVGVVLDNYSPHKHHKVKAWREAHLRFHFHFIPTYSSWLNRVEAWFSTLQTKTHSVQGSPATLRVMSGSP